MTDCSGCVWCVWNRYSSFCYGGGELTPLFLVRRCPREDETVTHREADA